MNEHEPVLRLREIRSFCVGGCVRSVHGLPVQRRRLALGGPVRPVDPNGEHITGQMYVQAYLQAEPRHRLPVLLWHGGGMTGANWESTPDGRAGWLSAFLHAGFDVYVSDAVERGRASWSPWPDIYADAPLFRTLGEGWELFRIGPPGSYRRAAQERVAHAGQQFPVAAFEAFAAQWVPRWVGHEHITLVAYDALLQHVGECIVVGHSQGGGFALEATRRRPGHVAAVVALEPSGAPEAAAAAGVRLPPHLAVWGDYMGAHALWRRYRATADAYFDALHAAGMQASVCELPREGIVGNSHFPMLDRNSDTVAQRVIAWLDHTVRP
ncbi:alpha/beta fold hydrolase [Verminephrobacter aporrectodeae]|uniref:alpha/beta fold hydrolase n=1 Tax=Verminephrobacter aporrectodeae TaxID=1110389 RepID=UPI0002378532|nr:alpha/beta fold hydrolase [Verminephrobacter aporrectodeae]